MRRFKPGWTLPERGRGAEDDVAQAVLAISSELEPQVDVTAVNEQIDGMVGELAMRLGTAYRAGDCLFQLNTYLFDELGFNIDAQSFDGARPAARLLHEVLATRRGSPLAIGVFYLVVGQRLGLPLHAVRFAGRLLICYQLPERSVYLDPAAGGLPLQSAELAGLLLLQRDEGSDEEPLANLLRPVSRVEILLLLLSEVKQVYSQLHIYDKALWAINRMLFLRPGMVSILVERGHLYELLDCTAAAVSDYRHYLERLPWARDSRQVQRRLERLLARSVAYH